MKRMAVCAGSAALVLLLAGGAVGAGPLRLAASNDGGNGLYVNLIVREVRVTPVVAHVGDPVRIEAVIESRGEGYGTIPVRVYANGKSVASRLFTYDTLHGPSPLYRESFVWDTRGARPGEYRIRAEAFEWVDASPFDNSLDVKEPVTLLPAGAAFPPGVRGGGEAVAVDPRWHPRPAGEGGSGNSSAPSVIEGKTASGRPQ